MEIQVAVGCVVQLRMLHIVKISVFKKANEEFHTMAARGCVWKIFDSSLPQNELEPRLLYVGLVNGN